MISTPGCKHNKIWNTCEECRPNLVDPNSLFEKLAAIEHERWADWQRYVHSKMTPSADDGIWLIGEAFIDRWERQIRTPYAELTEEEKESDRNQVRRYWDLITVPNERNEESAVKSEFIRDMTSVVPRPKSEVRRRLEEILQAERTRIIKALEGLKVEESGHDKVLRVRYNHAINQAIKAVGERSESDANSARKESK